VKQLGDNDAQAREAASERLRAIGRAALPALEAARQNPDAEVVARAQAIARQIEQDLQWPRTGGLLPAQPPPAAKEPGALAPDSDNLEGQIRTRTGGGGGGGVAPARSAPKPRPSFDRIGDKPAAVAADAAAGRMVRETNANDGDTSINIRETTAGITIITRQRIDGADVTRTTTAADKDSLKRDFPEEYVLYKKYVPKDLKFGERVPANELFIHPLRHDPKPIDPTRMFRDPQGLNDDERKFIDRQFQQADEQLREARRLLEQELRIAK
jgi:hypothetical protein